MLNSQQLLLLANLGTKNNAFSKQQYIFDIFSFIAEESYEDEFIVISNQQLFIKIDDEEVLLVNKYTEPLADFTDKLSIPKGYLVNINNNLDTTIGRLIMNYLMLVKNFSNKIPYINKPFNIGTIEKDYITTMLTDDPNQLDKIQISEYHKFLDATTYIEGFSKVLSIAGTEKALLPPDGIEEYKKKVLKEIKDKHKITGKIRDPKIIAEVEAKLKAYEDKWLEGDKANGRLLHGKTMLARKKMYLNIGVSNTFNGKDDAVENSLLEGWDSSDPETLATLFNDARSGSYYRGNGTKDGGVSAKILLRATSDINVVDNDCGSKLGLKVVVTESMVSRYILVAGKPLLLTKDNIGTYKGKVYRIRSPLYCSAHRDFCATCTGEGLRGQEKGISLLSIDIAGKILDIALKAFHSRELSIVNADIIGELS